MQINIRRHKDNRSLFAIGGLVAVIALCSAGIRKPDRNFQNLQVLPQEITTRNLNSIMVDEFEDGLGVRCTFCHSENKTTHKPDYASDEKPEKAIARKMMRMTLGINKRYFKMKHPLIGDALMEVRCVTCHNGQPHPEGPGR